MGEGKPLIGVKLTRRSVTWQGEQYWRRSKKTSMLGLVKTEKRKS